MRSHSITVARAKTLRGRLSPPEVLLWLGLRRRAADLPRWRRQHPISPYIADFYCSAASLVAEIDGAGHGEEAQDIHDRARDSYLQNLGYRVLRISAADVMGNADEVADGIVQAALELIREAPGARLRAPSPARGG
jgi:very-short-patch-repair endonuclease